MVKGLEGREELDKSNFRESGEGLLGCVLSMFFENHITFINQEDSLLESGRRLYSHVSFVSHSLVISTSLINGKSSSK